MSRLIDADVLLDDLKLYEKELRNDREIAVESDDEQMLFAIMNQETAIYRIRQNVLHSPTAYNVDKVVEELEDYSMWKEFMIYDLTHRERKIIARAIEIAKGGGVNER